MTNPDQEPKSGVTGTPEPGSADAAGSPASGAGTVSLALPTADELPPGKAPGEDHLAAVTALSSEAIANIDSTLDQLTSATDLFDIPAFDLDA
jgi:hypothetical protein